MIYVFRAALGCVIVVVYQKRLNRRLIFKDWSRMIRLHPLKEKGYAQIAVI